MLLIDCNHPHLNDTMVFDDDYDDDDDEKTESALAGLTAACTCAVYVCMPQGQYPVSIPGADSKTVGTQTRGGGESL